jgi:hypothetical protein
MEQQRRTPYTKTYTYFQVHLVCNSLNMQLLRDACLCNNSHQTTLGAFRVIAGRAAIAAIRMSPEWGPRVFSPVPCS